MIPPPPLLLSHREKKNPKIKIWCLTTSAKIIIWRFRCIDLTGACSSACLQKVFYHVRDKKLEALLDSTTVQLNSRFMKGRFLFSVKVNFLIIFFITFSCHCNDNVGSARGNRDSSQNGPGTLWILSLLVLLHFNLVSGILHSSSQPA